MAKRVVTPGMLVKPKANVTVRLWRDMRYNKNTKRWEMLGMSFVFLDTATCIAVPGRRGAGTTDNMQGAGLLLMPDERLKLLWVWLDYVMSVSC
jgi:hypothetical protein